MTKTTPAAVQRRTDTAVKRHAGQGGEFGGGQEHRVT